MKIYKLERVHRSTNWDQYQGFVVRAASPQAARRLAQEQARESGEPWLDPAVTTCRAVKAEGKAEILLGDFEAG